MLSMLHNILKQVWPLLNSKSMGSDLRKWTFNLILLTSLWPWQNAQCKDFGKGLDEPFPACIFFFFFFVFWVEISSWAPVPLWGQDLSTAAQQAELTVDEHCLTSCVCTCFTNRFQHYAWTAQSDCSNFAGSSVSAHLSVTCKLHF